MTVDPSVLEDLTARLGERGAAFRASLLQTWRDESTTRLRDLDTAAASGDRDGVVIVAHTLKSSSAALGAHELAAVCADVEDGLRAGHDRDLPADAAALRAGVEATDARFRELWP